MRATRIAHRLTAIGEDPWRSPGKRARSPDRPIHRVEQHARVEDAPGISHALRSRQHLAEQFTRLGAPLVYEEGLAPTVKDLLPALFKAQAAGADVLIVHLHAPSTALTIAQARAQGMTLPIMAGSAMHQPATAELLSPRDLAGVCAETAASPVSGGSPATEKFTVDYRKEFSSEPDAFAVASLTTQELFPAASLAKAKQFFP